ncbi:predicted protein [Nematostella vectensis]|uniref:NADH dehydrogenase [ubiquinone] 1 beta subcomplex subunit 8, mitochondrial n=1 Tax=Nematostella vectensis TaxID=45351 RepID=A7SD20_NEMVE|nr:predicted protein [Nematostella vectensis]|eukprot:XP_001630503.1 predicted protein [Nematostella vectensis]
MAARAITAARFARKSLASLALRNGIFPRTTVAAYHNAQSNPPLASPTMDNRTAKDTSWPQDGFELGDYPNLPHVSSQRRQFEGWWDVQDRRNFNEPIHEDEDGLNIWLWTEVECNDKYTPTEALTHWLTAFGLLGVVGFLSYLYDAANERPDLPREFPFDNLYLERGGDPAKDPAQDTGKVTNTLCGM